MATNNNGTRKDSAVLLWSRILDLPELNVVIFGFLLNFPWEFLQVPLYKGMAAAPHWEASKFCTQAALGDAGVMLVAYWLVAITVRSRYWVVSPSMRAALGFVACDVAISVAIETLAIGQFGRWAYTESMPIVPLLSVGLLPFLQWILLTPTALWFVRRQLS
jgi:hypothetical protein